MDDDRLNILMITVSSAVGGGPKHIFNLISQFRSEKMVLFVACPKEGIFWDKFNASTSGRNIEIPNRKFSIITLWKLRCHAIKYKIDIIHSHGKGAGVYGRMLSLITGIPLVHTPHGIHIPDKKSLRTYFYIFYERLLGRIGSVNIFVSNSEKKRAESYGFWRRIPSKIVHNGVASISKEEALSFRVKKRQEMGVGKDDFVVVTLSRFDFAKNMEELIRIAESLKPARFWLLGDGDDKGALVRYCENKAIKNVVFFGMVQNAIEYLAAADMYLSTSRWEGLPLAILESMSVGIPVVASEVTGNVDAVIDGETGFLYPLGQIEIASERVSRLMLDKEERLRLGAAGRMRQLADFSLDLMAHETMCVYQELIKPNMRTN